MLVLGVATGGVDVGVGVCIVVVDARICLTLPGRMKKTHSKQEAAGAAVTPPLHHNTLQDTPRTRHRQPYLSYWQACQTFHATSHSRSLENKTVLGYHS